MCRRCGEHRSLCICHLECEDCGGTGRVPVGECITIDCDACLGLGYREEDDERDPEVPSPEVEL